MKNLIIIFFILLLISSQAFAIQIVKETESGKPVVQRTGIYKKIVIDNSNRDIKLPPGLEGTKIIYPEKSDLPEEMKMLGLENMDNETESDMGALPGDMEEILTSKEEKYAGIDRGGNSTYSIASQESNNNLLAETAPPANTLPTGNTSNNKVITILWYIMGVITIALIIVLSYYISSKKKLEISHIKN